MYKNNENGTQGKLWVSWSVAALEKLLESNCYKVGGTVCFYRLIDMKLSQKKSK